MDREKKVEVVNICIVNALRIDEDHRMMILEKLIQSVSDENKEKLLRLLHDVGQREQLVCDDCGYEINAAGICINMNCSTNENP